MPLSSVGRASLSESEGPRFETASGHQSCCSVSREARADMGRSAKPEETGSTPVRASNWLQWLEWTGARFLLGSMRVRILLGAPNACVAQRMSARILSGMTLVRLQSQAPMTTLEHDPEKWKPVFGKRSCSNNKLERDDDSKKSHPALIWRVNRRGLRRRLLSGRSVRR